MVSVLKYFNLRKIVHRDLRPQNIIINGEKVKIMDLWTINGPQKVEANNWRYSSPEALENRLSLTSDIWSFGCLMLEICTGLKPY